MVAYSESSFFLVSSSFPSEGFPSFDLDIVSDFSFVFFSFLSTEISNSLSFDESLASLLRILPSEISNLSSYSMSK